MVKRLVPIIRMVQVKEIDWDASLGTVERNTERIVDDGHRANLLADSALASGLVFGLFLFTQIVIAKENILENSLVMAVEKVTRLDLDNLLARSHHVQVKLLG